MMNALTKVALANEDDLHGTQRQDVDHGDENSLIQWMLSLSPSERLEALQDFVDGITLMRHGRIR
jgi:hypothetical protein